MARVLIVASFSLSLRTFRGALIDEMCGLGNEVHAAAPELDSDEDTRGWLEKRGVICHSVSISRVSLNPLDDLQLLWRLTRLMLQVRPTIFLGYTTKPVVWGLFAARLAKVPLRVAMITGLGYAFIERVSGRRALVRVIVGLLYKFSLLNSTHVIFQNQDDRNDFARRRLLPMQVPVAVVDGSGVDLEEFSPKPLPKGPIRFLLIARLLASKGIREYADAAKQLRLYWPDVRWHLVGGTDKNPDGIPEAEVRGWHEAGDVVWHGELQDVRQAIAGCHICVLPSYREGVPRTILEGMSMARPIITTDAPGCRETVKQGVNGYMIEVASVKALKCAMETFLRDPSSIQPMGLASREIAEKRFDVRKVNDQILNAMGLRTIDQVGPLSSSNTSVGSQ